MDEKKFIDTLGQALENLVTLKVTTVVGKLNIRSTDDKLQWDDSAKVLSTQIDLVSGDVVTGIDPSFITGEHAALRDFHAAREKQGQEIIRTNVETLKSLLDLYLDSRKKLAAPTSPNGQP